MKLNGIRAEMSKERETLSSVQFLFFLMILVQHFSLGTNQSYELEEDPPDGL
jgi:hypothetical protein